MEAANSCVVDSARLEAADLCESVIFIYEEAKGSADLRLRHIIETARNIATNSLHPFEALDYSILENNAKALINDAGHDMDTRPGTANRAALLVAKVAAHLLEPSIDLTSVQRNINEALALVGA